MGEYGYTNQRNSTYNSAGSRTEEAFGPATRRPFVPFVPNPNRSLEGYATRKTAVPVASRPYDDEYKHSPPSERYRTIADDDSRPQKVDEFLNKVQNEATRPSRLSPMTSTDWRQSPQSTIYTNGANGYRGDYGNYSNKEGRKPIGGVIRKDNYDGYNGANGYGDYGSPIRSDNYGGYNGTNGYGDYGNYSNKEGHKPMGSPIRNDNYDGNGYNDYGNYSNKGDHKPIGSAIRNDNFYSYQPAENYSAVEPNRTTSNGWTRPKLSSGWATQLRKETQPSEATNGKAAAELLKDVARLTSSGHPAGVSGSVNGDGGYGREYNNKGGHKVDGYAYPNENYDIYKRRNDALDKPVSPGNDSHFSKPTSTVDKARELVKEADRLKSIVTAAPPANGSLLSEPINKLGKAMELAKEAERLKNVVTTPRQPRPTMPIEPTPPNKDDYRETSDWRDNTWRYGNFNFSSRPRTSPPQPRTIIDGREADYGETIDRRDALGGYGNWNLTINSKDAEKKYSGMRV